jgi:hypothetical protein
MTSKPTNTRRTFLKTALGASAAATGLAACQTVGPYGRTPRPSAGATYMGDFAAPALDRIRMGFIGVGGRGSGHVEQMLLMEGVDIVAICDDFAPASEAAAQRCETAGRKRPAVYSEHELSFQDMIADMDLDAVIIATPWKWHAPMGVAAMRGGAHAFIEVPITTTVEEMWDLVNASEETGQHCMMMENVNYGREELLFLNMVRKGAIGKLTHGEASYIHDLRWQMKELERGEGSWRLAYHVATDGNLYPTHGLGPVAQYMNCERGEDRFERLVSFSSPAYGRQLAAARDFPADHERNQQIYRCGDMNTSIIKTELGRTILVQHDTTSPRPYTRLNMISGTEGTLAGFPTRIALDPEGDGAHGWKQGDDLTEYYEKYEHPLYSRVGEEAVKAGGHGGMDFIMLWRMVYCMRNGLPLDQNVYEGCAWSAVSPLSEWSVANGGMPAAFPDFTRGRWSSTKPLSIVS